MSLDFLAYNQHFVCTAEEARAFLEQAEQVMVAACGCRKDKDCKRSHSEVCLWFVENQHYEQRPITRDEAREILIYGMGKGLVFRPFRSATDKSVIEGICICCDCCCSYFTGCAEESDKGQYVESTDMSLCNLCGLCVTSCYFKAREVVEGLLVIKPELCFGCGVCVRACPLGSISMKQQ